MALSRDYLNYLDNMIDIAPANSQEELQAAQEIASLMQAHKLETSIEEFDAPSWGRLPFQVLNILLFLGIFAAGLGGSVGVVGILLTIAAAVLIIFDHRGTNVFEKVGPSARSQNVVAVHKATGPLVTKGIRPIVVVAHYDTPKESFVKTSPLGKYLPLASKISPWCTIAVGVIALLQLFGFIPEGARRLFWVLGLVAALPLLLMGVSAIAERFSSCTEGANDNKAGVAALLGVLEDVHPTGAVPQPSRLRERPEPEVEQADFVIPRGSIADDAATDANREAVAVSSPEVVSAYDATTAEELPAFDQDYEEGPKENTFISFFKNLLPKRDEDEFEYLEDEPANDEFVVESSFGGYEAASQEEGAFELFTKDDSSDVQESFTTVNAEPEKQAAFSDGEEIHATAAAVPAPASSTEAEPAQIRTTESNTAVHTSLPNGNVRHGKEVIEQLGILPRSCEIEYDTNYEEMGPVAVAQVPVGVDTSEDYQAPKGLWDTIREGLGFAPREDVAYEDNDEYEAAPTLWERITGNYKSDTVASGDDGYAQESSLWSRIVGLFKGGATEETYEEIYDDMADYEEYDGYAELLENDSASHAHDNPDATVLVQEETEDALITIPVAVEEQGSETPVSLPISFDENVSEAPAAAPLIFEKQTEEKPSGSNEPELEAKDPETGSGFWAFVKSAAEKVEDAVEDAFEPETVEVLEGPNEPEDEHPVEVTEDVPPTEAYESTDADATIAAPASLFKTGGVDASLLPTIGDTGENQVLEVTKEQLLEGGRFGLVIDDHEESYGDNDQSGLDTIADNIDPNDSGETSPVVRQKPAAVEDTGWGESSYQPPASDIARRAALFDLPDPSQSTADPFVLDPDATRIQTRPSKKQDAENESTARTEGESSFAEWLGVDKDFDAKKSGREIGSWDNLSDEDNDGWKGGAALREDLRENGELEDLSEQGSFEADEVTEEEMRESILSLSPDELICHDIWFVAVGASDMDNAGMKAFLAEHRSDIRGAFLINLDSVGAGNLTLLTNEGLGVTRRADRRMIRLLKQAATDMHVELAEMSHEWGNTDATPAMRKSVRSLTIMGTDESGMAALSHTADDVIENVDVEQVGLVNDLVTELIRRS